MIAQSLFQQIIFITITWLILLHYPEHIQHSKCISLNRKSNQKRPLQQYQYTPTVIWGSLVTYWLKKSHQLKLLITKSLLTPDQGLKVGGIKRVHLLLTSPSTFTSLLWRCNSRQRLSNLFFARLALLNSDCSWSRSFTT